MRVISVDQALQPTVPDGMVAMPGPVAPSDITVTVEHDDGSQGTYAVRSMDDLVLQIRNYLRWRSDLATLQFMVGRDLAL